MNSPHELGMGSRIAGNVQQPQPNCLRRGVDSALRSISRGLDERRVVGETVITAIASAYFAPAAVVLIGLSGRQLYHLTHRQHQAQSVPRAVAPQYNPNVLPPGDTPAARPQPNYSSAREWPKAFMEGEIDAKTWTANWGIR